MALGVSPRTWSSDLPPRRLLRTWNSICRYGRGRGRFRHRRHFIQRQPTELGLASDPGAASLTGTTNATASAGWASFAGLSLNNPGLGYTLQATTGGLASSTTPNFNVVGTLTINDSANSNDVFITFIDATHFQVVINGGAATTYSTLAATKVVYEGTSDVSSEVVFADDFNTYTATQSLLRPMLSATVSNSMPTMEQAFTCMPRTSSRATVDVGNAASGSTFYVGDARRATATSGIWPWACTANCPALFPKPLTLPPARPTRMSLTSHAAFVGDPGGSSFTAAGFALTLNGFPQIYAVGAVNGTDTMTLHTEGGSFVGQPSFGYVSGTFGGAAFLIGALNAANVTAQATNATDQAVFYSYGGDTFNGVQGTSSLNGNATGFASFSTSCRRPPGFSR